MQTFKGKKVFLTGHTGFKGAWLTFILHRMGAEVMGYSLEPNTDPSLFNVLCGEQLCHSIVGDIRDTEKLHKCIADFQPDIVFIPSTHDVHQDHQTIAQEAIRAFKNTTLLGYELIWNNLTFNTQCFVELSEENLAAKQRALAKYASQKGRPYMSDTFIRSLAVTRGVQAGIPLAEVFEVTRLFL